MNDGGGQRGRSEHIIALADVERYQVTMWEPYFKNSPDFCPCLPKSDFLSNLTFSLLLAPLLFHALQDFRHILNLIQHFLGDIDRGVLE